MSGSSLGRWFHRKPKSAAQHYQERRERRQRQMGYSLLPVTLESIVDRENLYECFKKCRQGGQSPGVDHVTYKELSNSEVGEIMGMLSASLLNGVYLPQRTRPVRIPKPGSAECRNLNLSVLCDRVVAKALDLRLKPLWETTFLSCSYGFREARNPWELLADLEAQMTSQDRWVLAVDDIKRVFDNVPINEVLVCHKSMFDARPLPEGIKERKEAEEQKERLLWLIEAVVRGSDRTRGRGIDQGNPYSPTCLNAVLHYRLDQPLLDIISSPLHWFRYADNLCYLAGGVPEGRLVLRKVRRLLRPLGFSLKGEDGVQNLGKGKEVSLLGFTLRREGKQVVYGLGKKALDHLAQNLSLSHAAAHPTESAKLTLLGWLESAGPAFENGATVISKILRLAADFGFRELASPEELRRHWEIAWGRWQKIRERSYRRLQG